MVPHLDGHYLAQVIEVVPKEHAVNVALPSLSMMKHGADREGMKVSVLSRRAGNFFGEVDLPRKGDWGVVVFLQGSHQYAVWVGSLYETYAGLATGEAGERIDHHDSGVYHRLDQAGNTEWSHPSGLYLRVGSGTNLTARTRRQRQANTAASETVDYAIPARPTPTVHLNHPSGTTITIDVSGKVTVTSADEVAIEGEGKVTVQSGDDVSVHGEGLTHVGAESGMDFVALKAALDLILTTFNAHVHDQSDPPTPTLPAWVAGKHHTLKAKAT